MSEFARETKTMSSPAVRKEVIVSRIPGTKYYLEKSTGALLRQLPSKEVIAIAVKDTCFRVPTEDELVKLRELGVAYRLYLPFSPYPLPLSDLFFEPKLRALLRKIAQHRYECLGIAGDRGMREPNGGERIVLDGWGVRYETKPLIEL